MDGEGTPHSPHTSHFIQTSALFSRRLPLYCTWHQSYAFLSKLRVSGFYHRNTNSTLATLRLYSVTLSPSELADLLHTTLGSYYNDTLHILRGNTVHARVIAGPQFSLKSTLLPDNPNTHLSPTDPFRWPTNPRSYATHSIALLKSFQI
jgi:hypothetical protein